MADHFNAQTYLVTRNVEDGLGDKVAVRGSADDGSTTYAALDELCGVVAAALREVGVRRDDRVLLMMADGLPMLSTILGAFRAGAVAVPVSTMQTPTELGAVLADSGARLVVCTPQFAEAVEGALPMAPEVDRLVVVGDPKLGVPSGVAQTSWDDFLASGRSAPADQRAAADTDADAWALWLYTSGTTGLPKAAMHRHANIRHVCETYGRQVLGIRRDDVTFSVAKLFFAYGIGNSLFFPFSVGATTVLEPQRPTPVVVRDRVAAERPTLFFAVPTFYAALLASDVPDDTFASVRLAVSAGEPLPGPLLTRFKARFGVDIIDGIGSTEALHIFLSNSPGDIRPGTTGTEVPGYDVEIIGEDGSPVPAGQPGALRVRGESIALGYWRRTAASRQVFQGQWLVTGDTYVRDADGYFTCLGRNSDMLKSGGIWVSPAEVESRLVEHPDVREAAVVGVADEHGIDKPVAVVVVDPAAGVDGAALIAWCREGLAHYKAPHHVVFVDELPKTATGKLQRFKVRNLLAARPSPFGEPEEQTTDRPAGQSV
jgi:benzoate-CoA ligase family protein